MPQQYLVTFRGALSATCLFQRYAHVVCIFSQCTLDRFIFGFEAEPWNSLENIFYRSVRYAVLKARHSRTPPDLTTLRGLVFDELERKYSHDKHLRYEESEQVAISWYLRQRKERPLEPLFGK